jgi:hypothetical protein
MNNSIYNYCIGSWAVPVLINGDTSGLDPADELALDRFMDEVYELIGDGDYFHWDVLNTDPHFTRCEVSGKHDMCYDMALNIRNYKSPEVIDSELLEE